MIGLAIGLAVVVGIIVMEVSTVALLKMRRQYRERIGSAAANTAVGQLIDALESEAAVNLPSPRGTIGRATRDAVIGLIATISGPMRTRLVSVLETNGYVKRVIANLGARNASVRARCCMLLGGMMSPLAIDALTWRLHNDRDSNVRMTAAEALAEIGGASTADILLGVSKQGLKSHRLCIAISRMGSAVVPGLLDSLSDSDEAVLRLALDILSEIGTVPDVTPIVQLTRHPSPEVRGRAVHLLGVTGAVDLMPEIIAMTRDDVWFVRMRAVKGIHCLGTPDKSIVAEQYFAALARLLLDEEWWVRHHAAQTLSESGPRGCEILESSGSNEALWALQMHEIREGAA